MTLTTSETSLKNKVEMVKEFVDQNLLMHNVSKCEIVVFSTQPSTTLPVCDIRWVGHASRGC